MIFMKSIKDIEYYGALYSFYKNLLTDKQASVIYDFYYEDISVSELAQNYNISKAAVSDLLKRVENLLDDYEKKLHLYDKYCQRNTIYHKLLAYNIEGIDAQVNALLNIDEQ